MRRGRIQVCKSVRIGRAQICNQRGEGGFRAVIHEEREGSGIFSEEREDSGL